MAEQHAEQAGAEEAGEQAAEEARPIEEAANGRGYRRALRERAARLARLRHAALDGPHARRCRRRGRRRKCLRAATTETSAATGARIGVAHREGQHRRHGAKRKQRTKAQAKHGVLPERPFGSTQILVSHGGIVRGAAWCRSPLPPSHLAAAWILIGSFYSARPRESGDPDRDSRLDSRLRGNERWALAGDLSLLKLPKNSMVSVVFPVRPGLGHRQGALALPLVGAPPRRCQPARSDRASDPR